MSHKKRRQTPQWQWEQPLNQKLYTLLGEKRDLLMSVVQWDTEWFDEWVKENPPPPGVEFKSYAVAYTAFPLPRGEGSSPGGSRDEKKPDFRAKKPPLAARATPLPSWEGLGEGEGNDGNRVTLGVDVTPGVTSEGC